MTGEADFLVIRHFKRQFGRPKPMSRGRGSVLQFSPETAITLYVRQFLSLKHARFHKIFFLAPLERLLVSQVVLRRGCENSRRLHMRHIYETTKTKFSRACPAGTRVSSQVGCLLNKTEGKVDFPCNSAMTSADLDVGTP